MRQTLPRWASSLLPLLAALLLLLSSASAHADETTLTESLTFNGVVTSFSGKAVNTDLKPNNGNVVWHAHTTENSYINTSSNTAGGVQLGSGSYAFNGTISLIKTQIPVNAIISEIIVNGFCKKKQKSYTLSATVSGKQFGNSLLHTQGNNTTPQDSKFIGSEVGNSIVINFASTEKAYYNLISITVKYTLSTLVDPDEPVLPGKVVFSPEGGVVAEGTEVTLTCEGAEFIEYQTSSMATSDIYEQPIKITENTTITAKGLNDEGEGPECTATYRVKKNIPGNNYAQVKVLDNLSDLDDILVVYQCNNAYYAMTNIVTAGSKIKAEVVKCVDNIISLSDSSTVGVFNLVTNETGDKYAIKGEKGYVVKGFENTDTEFDETTPYYSSISLGANFEVGINISSDRKLRGYEGKDFRAYSNSSGEPIYFYKKVLMPKVSLSANSFEVYTGQQFSFEYTVADCEKPTMGFVIYKNGEYYDSGNLENYDSNRSGVTASLDGNTVKFSLANPGEYTIDITATSSDGATAAQSVKVTVLEKKDPQLAFTQDTYELSLEEYEYKEMELSDFITSLSDGDILIDSDNENDFYIAYEDDKIEIMALECGKYTITAIQGETTEYKEGEATAIVYVKKQPDLAWTHEQLQAGQENVKVYLSDALDDNSDYRSKSVVEHKLSKPEDINEDEIVFSSSNIDVAFFHPGLPVDEGQDVQDDVLTNDPKGDLYFLHAGETVITAEFPGNDTYLPQTVSYKLIVEHFAPSEDGTVPAPIPFNELYELITGSGDFVNGYTFSGSDNHHITFEHSDPEVVVYYNEGVSGTGSAGKPARVAGQTVTINGEQYTEMQEDPDLASKESVAKSYIYYPYGENPTETEIEAMKDQKTLKVVAVKNGDTSHASAVHKFVINPPTGISGVTVDADGEAEYYTLQGVKVVKPSKGIYIKVQGNKASKIWR